MIVLFAENVTGTKEDGTSDYRVTVTIGHHIILDKLEVAGHVREQSCSQLLKRIAATWEAKEKAESHVDAPAPEVPVEAIVEQAKETYKAGLVKAPAKKTTKKSAAKKSSKKAA